MRKRNKGRKLHRERGQRALLVRNLAASLIIDERITTTTAKAKAAQSFIEPLITRAKRGNLQDTRKVYGLLPKSAAQKLLTMIVPAVQERAGGYTRLLKIGPVAQHSAQSAVLEFTDREKIQKNIEEGAKKEAEAKKTTSKKKSKPKAAKTEKKA